MTTDTNPNAESSQIESVPYEGTIELAPISPERAAEIEKALDAHADITLTDDEFAHYYSSQRYEDKRRLKGFWYVDLPDGTTVATFDPNMVWISTASESSQES
jgi:hypothetical protein